MATHALVPQAAVLPLPEDVPFEVGAILGCAVMTGFGSAVNAARVEPGSTAVVRWAVVEWVSASSSARFTAGLIV